MHPAVLFAHIGEHLATAVTKMRFSPDLEKENESFI